MAIVISDSFVGAAGHINGHNAVLPAAPWSSIPSAPNDLYLNGSGAVTGVNTSEQHSFALAPGIPSTADYDVIAKLVLGASAVETYMGVGGRVNENIPEVNGYVARLQGAQWELYKLTAGGIYEELGVYMQALTIGVEYTLMLRMVADSIKLFVDGVERIAVTDATITEAGRAGLYWNSGVQTGMTATEFHVEGAALLPDPIIYDNFSGAAAALSDSLAITPAAKWRPITLSPDVFRVNGFGYAEGDLTGPYIAGTAAPGIPPANCDVTGYFMIGYPNTGMSFGVFGRLNEAAPGFQAYIARYLNGNWELFRLNEVTGASVVNVGADYAQVLTVGNIYKLTLRMVGTTISLLVNDVVRITGTDSALTSAGHAGLAWYTIANNGVQVASFRVDAAGPILFEAPKLQQTGGTPTSIVLTASGQIGGTAPFVYNLYRAATPDFTPGAGNLLAASATFPYTDSAPLGGKNYYKVRAMDNVGGTATSGAMMAQPYNPTLEILFIGDSLTAEGVSWPETVEYLESLASAREVDAAVWAVSGTTTAYWTTGITAALADAVTTRGFSPGFLVSICLGTNDCSLASNFSADTYKTNLTTIITAINAAGGIAVLHMPPSPEPNTYLGYINEASLALLATYETALNQLAVSSRVRRGDRQAFGYFGRNPNKLRDGIHPTEEGYKHLGRLWGKALADVIAPASGIPGGNILSL